MPVRQSLFLGVSASKRRLSSGGGSVLSGTAFQTNAEGTDGSQPSTGLDDSDNDLSLNFSESGTLEISTDAAHFGSSSFYSDGDNGNRLDIEQPNGELELGTDDFSIEFFFRRENNVGNDWILGLYYTGTGDRSWSFLTQSNDGMNFIISSNGGGGGNITTLSGGDDAMPSDGDFHHVVACRSGGSMSLFVDGTRLATAVNSTDIHNTGNQNATILNLGDGGGNGCEGYMDGIRIIVGNSAYDATASSITVPTSYDDYFE